jgi:hypothetical protein
VTVKFRVLFVANSGVDKNQAATIFYQQAAHGPGAQVVFVGGIQFIPDRFWNNAKHGASVEFEKAGIQNVNFHSW